MAWLRLLLERLRTRVRKSLRTYPPVARLQRWLNLRFISSTVAFGCRRSALIAALYLRPVRIVLLAAERYGSSLLVYVSTKLQGEPDCICAMREHILLRC